MPAQFNKRFFAYIIDIFIVLVIANLITMFIPISEKTQDYYKELQTTQKKMYDKEIDVKEYTDIEDSEIVKIEGGSMIYRILTDCSSISNKSVYLCTHSTLQTYGSQYGWDKISELFNQNSPFLGVLGVVSP